MAFSKVIISIVLSCLISEAVLAEVQSEKWCSESLGNRLLCSKSWEEFQLRVDIDEDPPDPITDEITKGVVERIRNLPNVLVGKNDPDIVLDLTVLAVPPECSPPKVKQWVVGYYYFKPVRGSDVDQQVFFNGSGSAHRVVLEARTAASWGGTTEDAIKYITWPLEGIFLKRLREGWTKSHTLTPAITKRGNTGEPAK